MGVATGEGRPAMTVEEWLKMQKRIKEQEEEARRKALLQQNQDRRYEDV